MQRILFGLLVIVALVATMFVAPQTASAGGPVAPMTNVPMPANGGTAQPVDNNGAPNGNPIPFGPASMLFPPGTIQFGNTILHKEVANGNISYTNSTTPPDAPPDPLVVVKFYLDNNGDTWALKTWTGIPPATSGSQLYRVTPNPR